MFLREIDKQVAKIDPAEDESDGWHDDVVDERCDNLVERRTDDDRYGKI